jgi:hypothetical protein
VVALERIEQQAELTYDVISFLFFAPQIFLLPEILNKLFCSNCWCWRLIYFLVLLPPMIGIETCGWILIICPMRYYLLSCLVPPECWRGFVRGCFSFWRILPYSVFEALTMI